MLETIIDVARRLSQHTDLEDVLEQVISAGRDALEADRASVFLLDSERNELYSQVTSEGEEIRFPADAGIAGQTLAKGQVLRINDVYSDARFNPEVDRKTGYRTECLLSVPLIGVDDTVVGVMQLLNARRGHFDEEDDRIAEMFGSLAAIGIQRARSFEDRMRNAKLEADLDVARTIQMNLLPQSAATCPGYEIASYFLPAEETGGDIFDVFSLHTGASQGPLIVLLADATGHGIGAAVSVTQVRSMLRMGTRLESDLDTFCRHLNNQLTDDLPSSKFVTAFIGALDPAEHVLDYNSMGQAPLLHFHHASGEAEWRAASTVPLGLMQDPPIQRPEPFRLEPGDSVVLLSDGFYEYARHDGEEFGKERVGAVFAEHRDADAETLQAHLLKELEAFHQGAPQADDLTSIVIRRQP